MGVEVLMGDLITVARAARELGVERQTAYRYIKCGRLPAREIAGRLVVDADDLEAVRVGVRGWPPVHKPDKREWTKAMVRLRSRQWNDAVESGLFDDPITGEIDPGLIAAWEIEHGWTHEELRHMAEKIVTPRDPFQ